MHDIHTHLYWHTYDADRDMVIARAREAGVEKLFVIGCTVEESRQAVELAGQYEGVYASVGIHPQEFNKQLTINSQQLTEEIKALRALVQNSKKVIAIGECGLEYYVHQPTTNNQQPTAGSDGQKAKNNQPKTINKEQKIVQKAGFLAQIELAKELELPLIVHCRASVETPDDAYHDLLAILQATSYKLPAILHCYMGDTEVTRDFLNLPNVYFSFTGNITYPVKKEVRSTKYDLTETVKLVPLERMFVETDCPFLSPQSHRGERNEPANVVEVATKVAELQGKTPEEVEKALEGNFRAVFPRA